MKNIKELFKNMGLLTLGNLSTKLIAFFLVPLYTNILTTTEYGIYDLVNNTIAILIPFLTLNISDSVFRFVMDKESDTTEVVSYSFKIYTIGFIILLAILLINVKFAFFRIFRNYIFYFILLYIVSSYSMIVANYARGKNQIFDISVSGVLSSAIIILLNILLLAIFRWGIDGYFIGNIIGIFAQCFYLTISTKIWKNIRFNHRRTNSKELHDQMLKYCKPLMVNSVAWWINGASDRYVITWFCGLAESGIYSIAYKIPSIVSIFQSIFGQAWTLFAIKEINSTEKEKTFSKMYNYYNAMVLIACCLLVAMNKIMARFLYAKDFYMAWRYVPVLLISSMFSALSAFSGGIFSAGKESKAVMNSSLIGATVNIILNIIFTPLIGAMGAAIATAVSYFAVWVARDSAMMKIIRLDYNKRQHYISYLVIILQVAIMIWDYSAIVTCILQIVCVLVILFIYKREYISIIHSVKSILLKEEK